MPSIYVSMAKKKSNQKDIGNLDNKELGVNLDPNEDLCLTESGDRGQEAFYKGQKINYMDYMGEVTERISKNAKGKSLDNIGMFSGVNFDKDGKIIK